MSKHRDLGIFILGLSCIIGGFLSFISITLITHQGIDINLNLVTVLGVILLVLGIILMYFFVKLDDKKKRPSK